MKRTLLLIVTLLLVSGTALAQPFVAGRDYQVLDKAQRTSDPDKVEVREFFSYACPHCFSFLQVMHGWVENPPAEIDYVRVPVVFNPSWKVLAQAYHTADLLGAVERIHVPLFTAIHVEKKRFRDKSDLKAFFAKQGVPEEDFERTFDSFAADARLRQDAQLMRKFRVNSTPTVAVNGKYVVNPRDAGSHERMIAIIDHLVKQEAAAQ